MTEGFLSGMGPGARARRLHTEKSDKEVQDKDACYAYNKVESLLIELHCITANAFYEFNDAEENQHTSDNRREESSTRTLLRRPETISPESQDNPDYAKDRGEDV